MSNFIFLDKSNKISFTQMLLNINMQKHKILVASLFLLITPH